MIKHLRPIISRMGILYTLCDDSGEGGEDGNRMPWLTLWPAVLGMAI